MKQILIPALLLTFCLKTQAQDNARMIGANDPNSDPSWVWYQEHEGGLDMWFRNEDQDIKKVEGIVQTPFFTSGHPLQAAASKKDMWPEDGWVLAYRDFGTPDDAKAFPFFILYNKYRGILRYMFYNAREVSYNFIRGELSFHDPEFSGALMTFSDDEHASLNDFDANNTLNFMGEVAVFDSWGYVDFQLFGYDPTMDLNSQLRIEIKGVDIAELNLESTEFTLEEVFDDANLEGSKGLGENLVKSFEKGQKFYKNANKAKKGLSDFVSSETKKLDEDKNGSLSDTELENAKWWFNAVSTIAGDDLVNTLPVIGGVAGFINSFFFSGEGTPTPMKFEGSLKLEGSITDVPDLLISDDFILNSSASPTSQYYIPVNPISLGVFNLIDKPIITGEAIWTYKRSRAKKEEYYVLGEPLRYVFNENSDLEFVSMKSAFASIDNEPTQYEDPILFESHVFTRTQTGPRVRPPGTFSPWDTRFDYLVLELKFETKTSKNNSNEILVYKTYSVDKNYQQGSIIGLFPPIANNLVLTDQSDYEPHPYYGAAIANNKITAGNNFKVGGSLNNAYLVAGAEIVLTEDFHAQLGSNFIASTTDFSSLENGRSSNSNFHIVESILPTNSDFYINANTTDDFESLRVEFKNQDFTSDELYIQDQILSVYPNPNSGVMNIPIRLTEIKKVSIELYDLNGNLVARDEKEFHSQTEIHGSIPFNVSSMKEGVYVLRITSGKYISIQRVIISN